MTTFAWPPGWMPQTLAIALVPNLRTHQSPYTMDTQVIDLVASRWRMTFTMPEGKQATGPQYEAFFNALHGRANRVTLSHFLRPVPRGTLRGGRLSLGVNVLQGANSINFGTDYPGATLLAGDIVGMGGELLMVAADSTVGVDAYVTVPLVNRVRVARAVGFSLVLDHPTATFMMTSDVVPIQYGPGKRDAFQVEFIESW